MVTRISQKVIHLAAERARVARGSETKDKEAPPAPEKPQRDSGWTKFAQELDRSKGSSPFAARPSAALEPEQVAQIERELRPAREVIEASETLYAELPQHLRDEIPLPDYLKFRIGLEFEVRGSIAS